MKCIRCGEEFNYPGSNICGNCADDLRDKELAYAMAADYEAEQHGDDDIACQQYEEAERRAYEAEEQHRID